MAIVKNCIICNKEFKRRGKLAEIAKTCSSKCFHKSRRKRLLKNCYFCGKKFEKLLCEVNKNKSGKHFCSRDCAFKVMVPSTAFKKGQIGWSRSLKRPEMSGNKHPMWKGGITPINFAIRNSLAYEDWRKSVFERDNYTCIKCGLIGGKLNADHIKPFALFPELRFELSNGQTLCEDCHIIKTIKDWKEYSFYGASNHKNS